MLLLPAHAFGLADPRTVFLSVSSHPSASKIKPPKPTWTKKKKKKASAGFIIGENEGGEEDAMQSDSEKNETLIRHSSRSIYRRLSFELLSPFARRPTVSVNSN